LHEEGGIAGDAGVGLVGGGEGTLDTEIEAGEAGGVLEVAVGAGAGVIGDGPVEGGIAGETGSGDVVGAGEAGVVAGRTEFRLGPVVVVGQVAETATVREGPDRSGVAGRTGSTDVSAGTLETAIVAFLAVAEGRIQGISWSWAGGVAETVID
jgi:hypothetical protein